MRSQGTLTKWDNDQGFGFITPIQGSGYLFVHISAFPDDGIPPRLNERISYEVETDKDGKSKVVRVMRPTQPSTSQYTQAYKPSQGINGPIGTVLSVLVVLAFAGFVFSKVYEPTTPSASETTFVAPPPSSSFSCDGRTHCSQMTSCDEARYFVKNCPNTTMDSDDDGMPCEKQWCN